MIQVALDLNWLRKTTPVFAEMMDKTIAVKKSEQEYKKLLTRNLPTK